MRIRENHTLTTIIAATGNATLSYAGLLAHIHNQLPDVRSVVGARRNGEISSISVQYHDRQRTTMHFHRVEEPGYKWETEVTIAPDGAISMSM